MHRFFLVPLVTSVLVGCNIDPAGDGEHGVALEDTTFIANEAVPAAEQAAPAEGPVGR